MERGREGDLDEDLACEPVELRTARQLLEACGEWTAQRAVGLG